MGEAKSEAMLTPGIPMPQWLRELEAANAGRIIPGDEAKMRFVIDVAVENVRHETGGPFSAAIFELATDRLVALVSYRRLRSRGGKRHLAAARADRKIKSLILRPARRPGAGAGSGGKIRRHISLRNSSLRSATLVSLGFPGRQASA